MQQAPEEVVVAVATAGVLRVGGWQPAEPAEPAGRVKIAVVADDLTGAADATAPFAAHGLAVSVMLTDAPAPDADVLAVLTDNRSRPAAEAAPRMSAAVGQVRRWGATMLFVKIDSVLRGHVRSDVSGALAEWPAAAVATPAFPGQGRTVRDGALFVHGERTVARVAEHFPPGVRVVDAETHDDLVAVARGVIEDGCVAVGSGGLSRALAEVLVDGPRRKPALPMPVTGVLVVAGSPHPVTRAQVAELETAGAEIVLAGSGATEAVVAALNAGRRVVLTGEVEAGALPAAVGAVPSLGLVLTGGATALAVASALGASELRLHGEVAEGMPIGELVTGRRRVPVVTKSGGFGARDALRRAAEALETAVALEVRA